MSMPEEHDYIGLSEPQTSDNKMLPSSSSSSSSGIEKNSVLNLKETELSLSLGLPGSDSDRNGVSLFGKDLKDESSGNGLCQGSLKSFVSGAKRGFSDAINGSGKWALCGSEVDLGKNDVLFSPRGVICKGNNNMHSCSCLPGSSVKEKEEEKKNKNQTGNTDNPASKAQVVGWPPIRSFRKNTLTAATKNSDIGGKLGSGGGCLYVKVSMEGAPYLRKIDLKTYCTYAQLSSALENMFSCFTIGQYGEGRERLSESHLMDLLHGSEYVLTYEDKDGDWMLVGDVPWEMFIDSCKRLRIMKGSDAIGLAPRTMQKCKSQN